MSKFDKQVEDLLARAMEQPGVVDAMRVYESQQAAIAVFNQAKNAVAPRWVVSTSTSSAASHKA